MLQTIVTWMLNSQSIKSASAAAGGSVLSVAVLMGVLDKSVETKIEAVNREMVSYVDNRHGQVSNDIRYIKENQREIKDLVKVINQRVYELNKRDRERY